VSSAKEQAYAYIKDRILRTPLTENAFLTEAEVAGELGVSRTPVREALRSLEAERLLQLVPNKGAFIPPISPREIQEVLEARILVETFCAERAVALGHEWGDDLDRLIEEQSTATDLDTVILRDRQFHSRIVAAAEHSVLADVYESLRDRQLRMGWLRAARNNPARVEQVVVEHRGIAAALHAADAPLAVRLIRAHIQATIAVAAAPARAW
jgi:DNA-binding GntR family transcriptional regulator